MKKPKRLDKKIGKLWDRLHMQANLHLLEDRPMAEAICLINNYLSDLEEYADWAESQLNKRRK